MKFGVHNHYNNNSAEIGDFSSPDGVPFIGECSIRVTNQGVTIFNLPKHNSLEEKLQLAVLLHARLLKKFGEGLSFATCAFSDCYNSSEMAPYYQGVKDISAEITTIYNACGALTETEKEDFKGVPIDYLLEIGYQAEIKIVEIIDPDENDRAEPAEGWKAFEGQLDTIYEECLEQVCSLLGPDLETPEP